ncbi:hypothetical protein ACFLQ2_00105 [archaeon]
MVEFVRVCPFCRSKNIESEGATALRTGSEVSGYHCNVCGKSFPPFMIIEVDESLVK